MKREWRGPWRLDRESRRWERVYFSPLPTTGNTSTTIGLAPNVRTSSSATTMRVGTLTRRAVAVP